MLYFIIFLLLAFYFLFNLSTLPYSNPFRLIMIFGKKGSGKTTLLAKKAFEAQQKGRPVYSNVAFPGVHLLDADDLGFYHIPMGSVVLWDEAGMQFDNRNFKAFKPETRDWFKLQRHYKVTVYLASQTFDVDKKLRDLCDEMYLVERRFRIFAYGKRIIRKTTLLEAKGDQESRIVDNLKFDSLLFFWAGSRSLTLIPRYAPLFDSFEAPALLPKDWPVDGREDVPLSRRVVYRQLVVNVLHALQLDRLRDWLRRSKQRADDMDDIDPDTIDFDDFFSHPADSSLSADIGSEDREE